MQAWLIGLQILPCHGAAEISAKVWTRHTTLSLASAANSQQVLLSAGLI
jgi:hypothetical protein